MGDPQTRHNIFLIYRAKPLLQIEMNRRLIERSGGHYDTLDARLAPLNKLKQRASNAMQKNAGCTIIR